MITVTLPNGQSYDVKTLLGDGDSNAKMSKSDKIGKGYLTFGLSLAPANVSGYQVCSSSSPGCRAACLFSAGHGRMQSVINARIAKTIALFKHKHDFLEMLKTDLDSAQRKANKQGKVCAIRLNVLSDIMWEDIVPGMFDKYSDIQYYDYSKHYKRMINWCKGKLPSNYHLTFSRSECNEDKCLDVLKNGGNVTVVFNDKNLPDTWKGYRVVDGDSTDLRFLDDKNVVVGLYMKGKAKKDSSGFVVNLL